MALDCVVELILRPIVEIVFYLAGYLTGYVVVPAMSFGNVVVEPDRKGTNFNSGGRIKRRTDGKLVMEAETATWCGIIFWVFIAVGFHAYLN